MYCTNCGKKIDGGNKYCTSCGVKLDDVRMNVNYDTNRKESGMKVASIVLGSISILGALTFLFSPIALIISVIGLILGFCALKKDSNLPGILLSSIGFVLSLIMSALLIFLFIYVIDDSSINDNHVDEYYDEFYYDNDGRFDDIISEY